MSKKNAADPSTVPAKDASDDDPTGCCMYTNASGQRVCEDDVKKSECDQIPNSIFIEGGTCQ